MLALNTLDNPVRKFWANIPSEHPARGWNLSPCSVRLLHEGHDLLQGGLKKAPGRTWLRGSKSFPERSEQHISVFILKITSCFRYWTVQNGLVKWFLLSLFLIVLSTGIGDIYDGWIWIKKVSWDSLLIRLYSAWILTSFSPQRVGQIYSFCIQRPMTVPTIFPTVYFFPWQRSSWLTLPLFGITYSSTFFNLLGWLRSLYLIYLLIYKLVYSFCPVAFHSHYTF